MLRRLNVVYLHNTSVRHGSVVFNRNLHKHALAVREEPKYPPIIDTSREGQARHQRQLFYDSVQALPTVEQKLYEITLQRSFFERTYMVSSCAPSYLGVPFQLYVTRTHLLQTLPQSYQTLNVDQEYERVKPELESLVSIYFSNRWHKNKLNSVEQFNQQEECGASLANALLSQIFRTFAASHEHLLDYSFERDPSLSSYWFHGDFLSKKNKVNEINLCFQFNDNPACTVRSNKPLPAVLPFDDALCATPEVIKYNYQPKVFGIPYSRYHITSRPGFWPGDPYDFPLVQVHTSNKVATLASKLDHFDLKTIEDGYGVMASFGWLNGLATYQGFTAYHDLTYPIVGHTILTNGQEWTFFVYQLNTMCFHSDLDKKDKRNVCWTSGKLSLFEAIENGQLKGVNDEVFKLLLKFVLTKPEVSSDVNLKPYVGADTRTEEEIEEMRAAARKLYRNVPGPNYHKTEIPMWHHVYKRHPDAPPSPWIRLE